MNSIGTRKSVLTCTLHKLWIQCDRPRAGVINTTRLKAKNDYKLAYKRASADFEKMHAYVISDHLLEKDINSFWRVWNFNYNKNSEIPASV